MLEQLDVPNNHQGSGALTIPGLGKTMTGPQAGEHESDTSDVAANESPAPEVTDMKPEAGSESSVDLSKEPLLGPKRWRDTLKRLRTWLSDPPWWVTNGLVALFISLVVYAVQAHSDNKRDAENQKLQQVQAQSAQRLDDLRFVRERASRPGQPAEAFSGFDLQCQDLAWLPLDQAIFEGADLRHTNLPGIGLTNSDLLNADVRGADMVKAVLDNSGLVNVDFTGADLTDASLRGALLHGATLISTVLKGADLTGAHLEANDTLVMTGHQPERLAPANLAGADLEGAKLDHANLSGANLSGADLANLDLTSANLTGANLSGIYYDTSTKWPAGLPHPKSAAAPDAAIKGPDAGPGGCTGGTAPEPTN
jgi:uncharacterized protein YjbI with pentapeptide repeats